MAAAVTRRCRPRVRDAAAEPRDRLDVHRRCRRVRARARRRPDDGAARQDARRLVGDQLHGLRPRPSRRLRRWAAGGATGWSYDDVLPYFKKSEGLAPSGDIVVDADAHNTSGPLGVSVRSPVLPRRAGVRRGRRSRPASRAATTTAATVVARRASCRCCRPPPATASARAPTTRSSRAKPSSARTSTVICDAHVDPGGAGGSTGQPCARPGVEYRTADGETGGARAAKEVDRSAPARSGRRSC